MIPVCSAAYFRLLCCTLCFRSRRHRCQIIRRGHGCGCGCGRGGDRQRFEEPHSAQSARAKAKRAIVPRQSKIKKSICFLRVREWTDDTGSTSVSEGLGAPFASFLPSSAVSRSKSPEAAEGFRQVARKREWRNEERIEGTGNRRRKRQTKRSCGGCGGRKWMIGQGTSSISGVLEVSFLSTHPFIL